jgi:putative transposase
MSRCVRRAFLCGVDHYSGYDYEHRRSWLEDKLHHTASVFAIKVCAHATMNNRYHVIFNVRSDLAQAWSDKEVVVRWLQMFAGTPISQRFAYGVETLLWVEFKPQTLAPEQNHWPGKTVNISL